MENYLHGITALFQHFFHGLLFGALEGLAGGFVRRLSSLRGRRIETFVVRWRGFDTRFRATQPAVIGNTHRRPVLGYEPVLDEPELAEAVIQSLQD